MKKSSVYLDTSLKLIQQVRALHAVAEAGVPVFVPQKEAYKLEPLKAFFNMEFKIAESPNSDALMFSELISINHEKPVTSIGSIDRCLIFPKSIPEYLMRSWPTQRRYRFSFSGLVTSERKQVIESWLNYGAGQKKFQLPGEENLSTRILIKVLSKFGIWKNGIKKIGPLYIWSSKRGRSFPIKSWDAEYFKVLCDSEFVLCPSGDYIWSYRFFESILCGAIPIVEAYCDAYEGFRFYYMKDNPTNLKWQAEDAIHNFEVCKRKLTIPEEEIKQAIGYESSLVR